MFQLQSAINDKEKLYFSTLEELMRSADNCQCQSQDKSTPETREQSLERRSLVNWMDKI